MQQLSTLSRVLSLWHYTATHQLRMMIIPSKHLMPTISANSPDAASNELQRSIDLYRQELLLLLQGPAQLSTPWQAMGPYYQITLVKQLRLHVALAAVQQARLACGSLLTWAWRGPCFGLPGVRSWRGSSTQWQPTCIGCFVVGTVVRRRLSNC